MSVAIHLHSIIRLAPDQAASALGTETILVNYRQGAYYELNELGGFIWSLLQEQPCLTVSAIQNQLLEEFDVESSLCERELMNFLDTLLREKLILAIE